MNAHRASFGGLMHIRSSTIVGIAAVFALLVPAPARPADLDQVGSLKWIPSDAAFYSSSLRGREQIEIIAGSKAWAKLQALPMVQMGKQMLAAQLQNPPPQFAPVLDWYNQKENQELLGLLGDMFGTEMFIYGDHDWAPTIATLMSIQNASQFAPLAALVGGEDPQNAQAKALLQAILQKKDKLHIPTLVMGFKVTKKEVAQAQLKRLDELVKMIPKDHPVAKMISVKTIAGSQFLTFEADGTMVPWEQIPVFKEDKTPEMDALLKELKKLKLRVALGRHQDYLLFSMGESYSGIEKLGKGASLATIDEFKPLLAHANKRLTSVAYVSKQFRDGVSTSSESLGRLADIGKTAAARWGKTPERKAQIEKDISQLMSKLTAMTPPAGSLLQFAYMTERGGEEYTYDWTESPMAEASKPLTLLNHLGSTPILGIVGRTRSNPEGYDEMVKGLGKLYSYVEEYVVPELNEEQRKHFKMATETFLPYLRRLSETTRTKFIPGFADGQNAFVLDGQLKTNRVHMALPAFSVAVPVPELGIVLGVSDAKLVREAFSDYRKIINEILAKIRELNADFPELAIPEPKVVKVKDGELFTFPVFGSLGLDPQIVPAAGLSDRVAVVVLSPQHAERLLASHALKVDGGPLADLKKNRSSAVYFNFPAFLDLLSPWLEAGVGMAKDNGQLDENTAKGMVEQGKGVLEILKVFKGYTSSTYMDGKATVTFSESVFKDL